MLKCQILLIVFLSQEIAFSQFQLEPPETVNPLTIQTDVRLIYENVEDNYLIKCSNVSYPYFLLRFGIIEWVELQLNIQYCSEYIREQNEISGSFYEHKEAGIQPIKGGIKFMLNEGEKLLPSTALLVNLSIPKLASRYFRQSYIAPEIIFAASHEIKKLAAGYNIGFFWDGETEEPNEFYVVSLTYSPFEFAAVFAESYGFYKSKTPADNRIDAGICFFITENLQLDIAAGFGISESSPKNFIGGGIYYSLPEF